ncbi:MAG: hypothetical protein ACI8RN_000481 [Glaciecola sp.]|jgi:hypothetical protein|uniref:hypothetical protein n=1 Tax=Congregibacter sp. TaxID=2744308 RepID=UPI0039E3686F
MKKIIVSTIGIVLAAGAVSAFAGKADRESLAQCTADIESYYGDSTRTRLRSIKRSSGETHLRLMVNPKDGENTVVVCSVGNDGSSSLANGDGVALITPKAEQKVSYTQ